MTAPVSASIPLELVTPALFVGLYRLRLTQSDRLQACQIVFGRVKPALVNAATKAMNSKKGTA